MAPHFEIKRRVEFRDTDAAGIVHFSVFFTYMEQVEHAFLRQLGMSIYRPEEPGQVTWPRVSASCDYRRPIRFGDEIAIRLSLERIGNRSLAYRIVFARDDDEVAEGRIIVACCQIQDGRPVAVPVPDETVARLKPHLRPT